VFHADGAPYSYVGQTLDHAFHAALQHFISARTIARADADLGGRATFVDGHVDGDDVGHVGANGGTRVAAGPYGARGTFE
jgi:hypothetical protein